MTSATLYVFPDRADQRRGRILFHGVTMRCALGRGGVTRRKREGDGATPCAVMRPLHAYWRADRLLRPRSGLPLTPIRSDDGWCDDVRHWRYNRPVKLPFPASHEVMTRPDAIYDIVVDLDWNRCPAIPGRGSAIFFHLARPGLKPTEGCIAVQPKAMRFILPRLRPTTRIVVHA